MDLDFSAYQNALVKYTPKEFDPEIGRGFYLHLVRFLSDFHTISTHFKVAALDMEIVSNPWEPTTVQLFLISNQGDVISEPSELQKYALDPDAASNSKHALLMENMARVLRPSLPDDNSLKRLRIKQVLHQMNSTTGDFESLRSSEFSLMLYAQDIPQALINIMPTFVSDLVLEQKIKKSIKPSVKKSKKMQPGNVNRF